jgi:hypothetical protein
VDSVCVPAKAPAYANQPPSFGGRDYFFIRNCKSYLEGHSDHYLIYADLILINES